MVALFVPPTQDNGGSPVLFFVIFGLAILVMLGIFLFKRSQR